MGNKEGYIKTEGHYVITNRLSELPNSCSRKLNLSIPFQAGNLFKDSIKLRVEHWYVE